MAYQFNGSNQYLYLNSSVVNSYPFTLCCWANVTNACQVSGIGNSGSVINYYYLVASQNNTRVQCGVSGAPDITVTANTGQVITGFVFCAMVFDTSTLTAYCNTTSNSVSHSSSFQSVNRVTVGAGARNNAVIDYANGSIAEVGMWNAALTPAEMKSLAAGFIPAQIRPQSLMLYAPLVRDLIDVRDGRAITNVNSATVATHPRIIS